ncbi:MAG: molecular chaperone DnaJ [Armatimonadetes bacterium]|nr:molecular chaperone DnaJ [Armatimonadota bacterium]
MDQARDFYDVLGVPRSAAEKDIRKAYKRLARKYHPDVNPGDKEAERRFKEITEAHNVLTDPEKRRKYDEFGRAYQHAQQSGQWQTGNFDDFLRHFAGAGGTGFTVGGSFSDIFGDLFGRTAAGRQQAQTRGPRQGESIEHELEIPFEEAISGAQRAISLTIRDRCATCDGVGGQTKTCSACGGSGMSRQSGGVFNISAACPRCHGAGREVTGRCKDCGGSGEVLRSRRINVRIPPGVDTGKRIVLRGEGAAGADGGPRGDLILRAKVGEHPFFKRHGADIHIEVPVKFTEAALGAEIDVPSVRGTAKLKIPAGTKNGQVLRLRGMGVDKMGASGRGDELVKVVLVTPSKLTREQKECLERVAADWTEDPRKDLPV